jgi:hypothetical protein
MDQTNTLAADLVIDAEYTITGLSPDLAVLEFDKQGYVRWDKELFAANVYQPFHLDGAKVYYGLKEQKRRPLNGHFAFWLQRHPEQIPEEWKQWEMIFMGGVITHVSFIYHPHAQPELTCVKLWFEQDEWKVGLCNFSSRRLKPNHRIPLLPQ